MPKIEILTDSGLYHMDAETGEKAVEAVQHMLKTWGRKETVFFLDTGNNMMWVPHTAVLKHIGILSGSPAVEAPQAAPSAPEKKESNTIAFNAAVSYLGHDLVIKGIQHSVATETSPCGQLTVLLPILVNDQPALDTLDPANLGTALGVWAKHLFQPGCYCVLVPPAQITDQDEAREYIRDYVAELERETPYKAKNQNARAYFAEQERG